MAFLIVIVWIGVCFWDARRELRSGKYMGINRNSKADVHLFYIVHIVWTPAKAIERVCKYVSNKIRQYVSNIR